MAATGKSVTSEDFAGFIQSLALPFYSKETIAVAVSGGGDSMALAILLAEWGAEHGHPVLALTVDHGLRAEAAAEAKFVAKTLKAYGVKHKTLQWEGVKPKTRIQELARSKRYELMAAFCATKKIRYLFVAHHAGDQAETILFRLAKGSGVEGLAGIQAVSSYGDSDLLLVRPLLGVTHNDLIATCRQREMEWVEDPSNQNTDYARVRIRNITPVLEEEGMTPDRLGTLSTRITRLMRSIDEAVENEYKKSFVKTDSKRIETSFNAFLHLSDEVQIRLLQKILGDIAQATSRHVRLEEVERLQAKMVSEKGFRGATLGGLHFRKSKGILIVAPENGRA